MRSRKQAQSLPQCSFFLCWGFDGVAGVNLLHLFVLHSQSRDLHFSLLALASGLAWVSALFLIETLARTESLFQSGYFRNSSTLHESLLESANEPLSRNSRSRDALAVRVSFLTPHAVLPMMTTQFPM
jgi:hypothetical protein